MYVGRNQPCEVPAIAAILSDASPGLRTACSGLLPGPFVVFAHGIFRITAASPPVSVANPKANAVESIRVIRQSDADLVLLPELGLTAYTCGDLFATDTLLDKATESLMHVVHETSDRPSINVVGLPLRVDASLMNVAVVFAQGRVLGIVPKSFCRRIASSTRVDIFAPRTIPTLRT